jgi:hypothetical protein
MGIKKEQQKGKRVRARNDKARKAMLLLSASLDSTHPIQSKNYLHPSKKEKTDWELKKNNEKETGESQEKQGKGKKGNATAAGISPFDPSNPVEILLTV